MTIKYFLKSRECSGPSHNYGNNVIQYKKKIILRNTKYKTFTSCQTSENWGWFKTPSSCYVFSPFFSFSIIFDYQDLMNCYHKNISSGHLNQLAFSVKNVSAVTFIPSLKDFSLSQTESIIL